MQATQATAKAKVLEIYQNIRILLKSIFKRRLKKNIRQSHCSNIKKK